MMAVCFTDEMGLPRIPPKCCSHIADTLEARRAPPAQKSSYVSELLLGEAVLKSSGGRSRRSADSWRRQPSCIWCVKWPDL